MKSGSSFKMISVMTFIAAMCGTLIVSTYEYTASRIEANKQKRIEEATKIVLPCAQTITPVFDSKGAPLFYEGFTATNQSCGFAIQAQGMGFADQIRVLYAYDAERKVIVGFTVFDSKETPGIGDKIQKDTLFLANFKELDVSRPIVAVKHGKKQHAHEIDGITGATISTKAIAKLLQKSVETRVPLVHKHEGISQ